MNAGPAQDLPQRPDEVTFPPRWCGRAVPDAYVVLSDVAWGYYDAQRSACETARLTQDLSETQALDWGNYLTDYVHALAGCNLPSPDLGGKGILPGGIDQFGLANLAAIGVAQPQLGRDDVDLLLTQFLDLFAKSLSLTDIERSAVADFLRSTAERQTSELVSGLLSTCSE
jgi:hypothetical protein